MALLLASFRFPPGGKHREEKQVYGSFIGVAFPKDPSLQKGLPSIADAFWTGRLDKYRLVWSSLGISGGLGPAGAG